LSPLFGFVAKQTGSYALAYAVPALAYVAVALYGFVGAKLHGSLTAVVPNEF